MKQSLNISAQKLLRPILGDHEAKAVTMLLFEKLFGLSQTDVLMGRADILSYDQCRLLMDCVERVSDGEPVQYVLGKSDFMDLELDVAPGVLIPRPETEELVGLVMEKEIGRGRLSILDIGTGSGCIALALKHVIPDAEVEAWDISEAALEIAKGNAERLGIDVLFEKHDILEVADKQEFIRDVYDVIVSNPPYVCESERTDMEHHVVDHEPSIALFVPDTDPLIFYDAIVDFAGKSLKEGGGIYFEINRAYGDDVVRLLNNNGYSDIHLLSDQFGNQRMVCARK